MMFFVKFQCLKGKLGFGGKIPESVPAVFLSKGLLILTSDLRVKWDFLWAMLHSFSTANLRSEHG